MDAMDYPTKERKICPKCIKSREKAIVSNKNSWDPSTQCCFYFWPVSFSSQCCSLQLTHQMLHTSIGRVRRQVSVPTILTETVHNVQSWTKMLRKMEFPMSSFKIKLLKALVTTNTPPSYHPNSSPPKKKKNEHTKKNIVKVRLDHFWPPLNIAVP